MSVTIKCFKIFLFSTSKKIIEPRRVPRLLIREEVCKINLIRLNYVYIYSYILQNFNQLFNPIFCNEILYMIKTRVPLPIDSITVI